MDYVRKTRVIANSYYNMGLERARLRDLSGAAECLKKSLHFNKYQTDARNLLGLIYYEVGEVGDALVQWVISMNLQPQENRADYYLGEIQRKKGSLDTERHMIRRFNQALVYAQNGSEDLAILQLVKVEAELREGPAAAGYSLYCERGLPEGGKISLQGITDRQESPEGALV